MLNISAKQRVKPKHPRNIKSASKGIAPVLDTWDRLGHFYKPSCKKPDAIALSALFFRIPKFKKADQYSSAPSSPRLVAYAASLAVVCSQIP
jgi:hypothetical protein